MSKATVVSREYLSRCTSSTPFSYVLGLLSLYSFRSAVSTPRRAVTYDFTFLFGPPLFAGSFAGHLENKIVPYRRPPTLHFANFRNMAVRITSVFSKFSQRDYRMRTSGTMYKYIHTYIHTYIQTDRQTPLAFYTLMWGSLRLTPISTYGIGAITGLSGLMLDISNCI